VILLHAFARDDDGFYTSGNEQLESDSYAITTEHIDLGADPAGPAPEDFFGEVRITAESTDGRPLFVGIAPSADVDRYLGGVARAELTDFGNGGAEYEERSGGAPRTPPGAQDFWVAQSEGTGEQSVDWDVDTGTWSVAVMNADGARGIDAEAEAAVQISWLIWVGIGLTVVGLLLTAGTILLIIRIGRRATPARAPTA
jgi:hypothetical protein